MPLLRMEHYLVLSDDIDETKEFYCDALGMREGFRPKLDFPGYWLYLGDTPCIHIAEWQTYAAWTKEVGIPISTKANGTGPVDHIAFNASRFAEMRARLVGERLQAPAKTCSTTSGSGNSSFTIRTASRSSSTFAIDLDFDWRTEVKRTDYGFIGVGRMGAHMARRLLNAGFSLTVFDTSKEATDELAKIGRAGRELGARGGELDRHGVPEPTDAGHRPESLLGPHGREEPQASSPTARRRDRRSRASRRRELAKAGIVYMDVPVSGGMAGARDGTLAVMVSGQKAVVRQARARAQELRQAVLLGEGAGPGASHEAREQPARGGGDRACRPKRSRWA